LGAVAVPAHADVVLLAEVLAERLEATPGFLDGKGRGEIDVQAHGPKVTESPRPRPRRVWGMRPRAMVRRVGSAATPQQGEGGHGEGQKPRRSGGRLRTAAAHVGVRVVDRDAVRRIGGLVDRPVLFAEMEAGDAAERIERAADAGSDPLAAPGFHAGGGEAPGRGVRLVDVTRRASWLAAARGRSRAGLPEHDDVSPRPSGTRRPQNGKSDEVCKESPGHATSPWGATPKPSNKT